MTTPTRTRTALLGALALLWTVWSCAAPGAKVAPPEPGVEPGREMARVKWWAVPAFSDDLSLESLIVAGRASLEYFGRIPADRTFRFGGDEVTAGELGRFLEDFLAFAAGNPGDGEIRKYLKKHARIYRGGNRGGRMLFTGYYEPVLDGSRLPGVRYTVPLYGLPGDLIRVDLGVFDPQWKGRRLVGRYHEGTLVPYYTRREIDRLEMLSGRGYEIAWVRDPVDAFFLHIQGSGKILLPDGTVMNVQYAGSNGRPYRAIGRLIADLEKIQPGEITARKIRKYLNEYSDDAGNIMDYNERYIFFREAMTGAAGSIGVPLTPGRSLATDANAYPRGALAYVETEVPSLSPDGGDMVWKRTGRFVFNQDTGGGVTGSGRVDLFFGTGPLAGDLAGEMKQTGRVFFLAPRKKSAEPGAPGGDPSARSVEKGAGGGP